MLLSCAPQRWLKMSCETEKTCLLIPQESRASCVFHTADEKDEIPGMGEDRCTLRFISSTSRGWFIKKNQNYAIRCLPQT